MGGMLRDQPVPLQSTLLFAMPSVQGCRFCACPPNHPTVLFAYVLITSCFTYYSLLFLGHPGEKPRTCNSF